jgi:peroxiredoxin
VQYSPQEHFVFDLRLALAGVLTLAMLTLTAGCGMSGSGSEPVAQARPAPAAPAVYTEAGDDATATHDTPAHNTPAAPTKATKLLDFTARTVGGEAFKGSSLAGKTVVLWFWAPDCMDCVREAPHVLAAQTTFHDSVTFVGVPGLGDFAAMRAAIKQMKIGGFTQVADPDGTIWKRFGVVSQPAYAFLDPMGRLTLVRGALGAKGITKHVAALVAR